MTFLCYYLQLTNAWAAAGPMDGNARLVNRPGVRQTGASSPRAAASGSAWPSCASLVKLFAKLARINGPISGGGRHNAEEVHL
jgi:hypothetical protein